MFSVTPHQQRQIPGTKTPTFGKYTPNAAMGQFSQRVGGLLDQAPNPLTTTGFQAFGGVPNQGGGGFSFSTPHPNDPKVKAYMDHVLSGQRQSVNQFARAARQPNVRGMRTAGGISPQQQLFKQSVDSLVGGYESRFRDAMNQRQWDAEYEFQMANAASQHEQARMQAMTSWLGQLLSAAQYQGDDAFRAVQRDDSNIRYGAEFQREGDRYRYGAMQDLADRSRARGEEIYKRFLTESAQARQNQLWNKVSSIPVGRTLQSQGVSPLQSALASITGPTWGKGLVQPWQRQIQMKLQNPSSWKGHDFSRKTTYKFD